MVDVVWKENRVLVTTDKLVIWAKITLSLYFATITSTYILRSTKQAYLFIYVRMFTEPENRVVSLALHTIHKHHNDGRVAINFN